MQYELGYRLGYFTSAKGNAESPVIDSPCETVVDLTDRDQFITGYYAGYRVNVECAETAEHSAIIAEIFELIGQLP